MEASPVSKLPRELRDKIYAYALTVSAYIEMCPGSGDSHLKENRHCNHGGAATCIRKTVNGLPLVCRQIHEEALPMFFSSNIFLASVWNNPGYISQARERMEYWICEAVGFKEVSLGPKLWSHVQRLEVDMGVCKVDFMD